MEGVGAANGPLGWLHDLVGGRWFAQAVTNEVGEIARLMEAGERGRGPAAHDAVV